MTQGAEASPSPVSYTHLRFDRGIADARLFHAVAFAFPGLAQPLRRGSRSLRVKGEAEAVKLALNRDKGAGQLGRAVDVYKRQL